MQVLRSYEDLAAWATGPAYVTVGFFDGVHLGHQHLLAELQAAAHEANALAVAVTFSNSPRRFHQPGLQGPEWHYLTTAEEKLDLLGATGIDACLILDYDEQVAAQTAEEFLEGLNRSAALTGLCVGFDTSIGCDLVTGNLDFSDLCKRLGLRFHWVNPLLVDGVTVKSSLIRTLVQAGDMPTAGRYLGRPYELRGEVIHGKGKGGSMLGIPTANLRVSVEKLLPPLGVYAGAGEVKGCLYPAAICLSSREQHMNTVLERESEQSMDSSVWLSDALPEAHLIGLDRDIYDDQVQLRFISRLRGWQEFSAVRDLREQMQRDIKASIRLAGGAQDE